MPNIFFTSDTHFNHKNIIRYCNRPFSSVEEMNEKLIKNWNEVIKPADTVYFLGDFAFYDHEVFIKRLNGHKLLIVGSHDKELKQFYRPWAFEEATPLKEINISGKHITLCHYAMRTWPRSHYGSWHLFGHSHGTLKPIGKSWDVGVDNNQYVPLSFESLTNIMQNRPENEDYINNVR